MADKANPVTGRSTATPTVTFSEVTKEIARRNAETQKTAREARTVREREEISRRRSWERL